MTTLPEQWRRRDPETLEDAVEENRRMRRILGALAAHGPTILELASAANIIGARRHDGCLHAYSCEIYNARRFLAQTRRPAKTTRQANAKRKETDDADQ